MDAPVPTIYLSEMCRALFFSPGIQPEQVGILIHFWTFNSIVHLLNENGKVLPLILGWYETRYSYILFY
jgi:hypothetical protein